MKIKAVGITNLTDARYFAAQGASWMHLDFRATSQNYIASENAAAIMSWVEGINFIGEWATNDVNTLNKNLRDANINAVQIGEDFPIENISQIEADTIFRKIIIPAIFNISDLQKRIDIGKINSGILDSKHLIVEFIFPYHDFHTLFGGSNTLNFTALKNLALNFSVSLDISCNEQDCAQLVQLNLSTLCLHGGEEEQVGIKSFEALDNIFDALETFV